MALPRIKYPVGIQTFPEIIKEKYFYEDKTGLIYELVNTSKYVFLSRPRRFGKSLLMSTIEAYFRGEQTLFQGLEIEKMEEKWESFPVFRFDLSASNYDDPTKLALKINMFLSRWEKEYDIMPAGGISERFSNLLYYVARKTGKRSVILIDEYDKPLLDCITDVDIQEKTKGELRGFYSVIKENDAFIRFAMLMGVTKFGKVSVFSGLNNMTDISLQPKYNAICGFTESEFTEDFKDSIKEFSLSNEISEDEVRTLFKKKYDGYRFANRGEDIYNPYSVLRAFDEKETKDFWFSSGSSSHLINLLKTTSLPLNDLEGAERSERALSDITSLENDSVPLLYQAGYLTIKGYSDEDGSYVLGFPNEEVRHAFWESLAGYFFTLKDASLEFNQFGFITAVNQGNPELFMRKLRGLFADTSATTERNKELHFQNVVAIVFKMLGFRVHTEVESSHGRCDMQLLTSSYVYIFEFKLDGSARKALDQIKDRGYAEPYCADNRTVYLIGANFSSRENTLTEWIIEPYNPSAHPQ